ncbi:Ig-like domain-containing protein [Clostridium sp. AWRP]|uniref:Ig-like domain-containing protein n=1 Tax=Clostridium sp. AWRP TaxID=2212991 RepID=UPI00158607A6|nr:Ig-like domain-containing protein [Clostridium sp. AWRP]
MKDFKLKSVAVVTVMFMILGMIGSEGITVFADSAVHVTSVSITPSYINDRTKLIEGSTIQLTAKVYPANATNKNIIWSSSNDAAASVDKDGKVTINGGDAPGGVTIKATSEDENKSATCWLPAIYAKTTKLTVDKSKDYTVVEGQTIYSGDISIKREPSNAAYPKLSTSDPSVVSIDSRNNIKGLKAGTAVVTVAADGGASSIKDCFVVTVKPVVLPTEITLDKTSASVGVKGSITLNAAVKPENATDENLDWSSSDQSIATVSYFGGVVTGVKEGTAIITAKSSDGNVAASCEVTVTPNIPVTGIKLDKTSVSLVEGQTLQLNAAVAPDNATVKNVNWTAPFGGPVSVNWSTGLITAESPGTAIVTAISKDNSSVTESCSVTVVPKNPVEEIKLDKTKGTLIEGSTFDLTSNIHINPENATYKDVNFTSSDTSIATVSDAGIITAIKTGTAVITITSQDNNSVKAEYTVVVNPKVPATGITLNKSQGTLLAGQVLQLVPTLQPVNTTDENVKWSTSDSNIATVDDYGIVKGIKGGTATITAATEDGQKSASCTITVSEKVPITAINLDKAEGSLVVGSCIYLGETAHVQPENATYKTVKWISSDSDVARVFNDYSGAVTGVKEGTATITAVSNDDNTIKAEYKLTVIPKISVTGITLDKTDETLSAGNSIKLVPTIQPDNAADKNVTWASSDTSIATVDRDGKVTGVSAGGPVVITATTEDGKETATCNITVTKKVDVTGVTLDISSKDLEVGDEFQLIPTVNPDNASNKNVTWSSSDTTIGSVDENGKVKALKAGKVDITVTTDDSKKTAVCSVNVNDKDLKDKTIELTNLTKTSNEDGSFNLGQDAKISINAKNVSSKDVSVKFKIALYDDSDKIIKYSSAEKSIKNGSSDILTGTIRIPADGKFKIKAFVCDDSMNPLSDIIEIPVK